jgi:hypothetical protein
MTRGLGCGERDCRVAALLAMTMNQQTTVVCRSIRVKYEIATPISWVRNDSEFILDSRAEPEKDTGVGGNADSQIPLLYSGSWVAGRDDTGVGGVGNEIAASLRSSQ